MSQAMPDTNGGPWMMPRGVIVLLGGAGVVLSVAGLKAIAGIAAPVLLAMVIVIGVSPLTGRLERRGVPGWGQTMATIVAAIGVFVIIAGMLVYAAVALAKLLPQYADEADDLKASISGWLDSLGVTEDQVSAALDSISIGDVSAVLADIAGGILGLISNAGFLVLLLLFICFDIVAFRSRLLISSQLRPPIGAALGSFVHGTRSYLVVSTVFGAIVGIIDAVALWAIGIPLPLLWGVISFITNFIPNVGFVLGVIPPALIALLQGGWELMLVVIALYSVINFVIQTLIQPKFVGESVNLATTVTFLALTIWAWILGPLGAFLAIPLTLLVKALLLDIDPSTRWVGLLMQSGKPKPGDLALLAPDPEPA